MKIISWNVAGYRAALKKGFIDFFEQIDADIFCLQEVKASMEQIPYVPEGYHCYLNEALKKGYSGTLVYTKIKPLSVSYGIKVEMHDKEGRVITLEYDNFYLVNVYVPNAGRDLIRLRYRQEWEKDFLKYLKQLERNKPVIVCGDFNVAHKEIDLKNPKTNRGNAGFTDEEREKMTELLNSGFTDSFRFLYPERTDAYTWWSYMGHARDKNIGWRIDYFIVSNDIKEKIKKAEIYPEVMGSDHCPIGLEIEMEKSKKIEKGANNNERRNKKSLA